MYNKVQNTIQLNMKMGNVFSIRYFSLLFIILLTFNFTAQARLKVQDIFTVSISNILKPSKSTSEKNLKTQNTEFLIGQQYKGSYKSLQQTNLFDYLDTKEGQIEALFYSDPLKISSTNLNSLQIFLFNPKYHDLKAVGILIDLDTIKDEGKWQETNAKIKVQKFWKGRSYDDEQTIENVNYTVQVMNINSNDATSVQIKLSIIGPNFKFQGALDYYHNIVSTLGYSLYTTFVVSLQIFCAISILKQIDQQNPAIIMKMSLLTLSICNIEDFYYTMLHIQYIMSSGTAYLFFVLPSIAYLVLFVIFDMKMLFLVWRSHHVRDIENGQALRKKLTIFYIQFYLGLFIYLTLNYFFQYQSWLIFLQHLILIPQIVHNVRVGNNPGFSTYFIVGFLGLRYLIPLYQRGCPGNHLNLEPMPVLVIILGILYAIQILILFLQSKYGPRFFIPKFLLPNYYNYNVKLRLTQENKETDCSICLLNIFSSQPTPQHILNQSLVSNQTLLSQISIMKTPCNHYFHKECLTRWIDVKLECPSCRKPLPAI